MELAHAPQSGSRARPRAAVQAGLSYLVRSATRPACYAYPPPDGQAWENCDFELRTVAIEDGRHALVAPSIHREGFELRHAPSAVPDFTDEEAVRSIYYREAAALALEVTGGARAIVFDHLLRRRQDRSRALDFGRASGRMAAANGRIHNDYSEASGQRRLELVLDDEHARRKVRRYSIVNLWRSIRGPILDTPLAVCDARTVAADELVVAQVRYPRRTGEIYFLTYAAPHRWTYFSAMTRDEALVFKQYDSLQEGVARFTPHAAFDHPECPPDAPLRESIEARCLVIYD